MMRSQRPAARPPNSRARVLALDIGGTKLAAGVVSGDGRVLARAVVPSQREDGASIMIERLLALGRRVVDDSRVAWQALDGVGIACGGPLDPWTGTILSPPNLPGWDSIPLTDMVTSGLGLPAVVDNDANAGALAEWWFGAGRSRPVNDLVYLTISTGVGGGLILDGRLYRGVTGNAGELGHLTVMYQGRQCGCGRRGCLEAYASGTSIAARAREALAVGGRSTLGELATVTARDVAAAAATGDQLAAHVWEETMEILGSAVANIVDIFDPALVVMGGGVTRAGDQLLQPVRDIALKLAYGPAARSAEIVLAGLGAQHDVVSAAVVALERLPSLRSRRASA